MCVYELVCVLSRRRADGPGSGRGHLREAAAAGGQATGEGVEAGGHLPGPELQGAGRHPGSGEGRDHAEAEDAGRVEGQEAAGGGHRVPSVQESGRSGRPTERGPPDTER